jgi:hypothetical protein
MMASRPAIESEHRPGTAGEPAGGTPAPPAPRSFTVSGGVSRVAKHLRITPTMVDDFLYDPVMGAYVLMGIKLDVFQACRLRIMWWTPNVIDSSGFGTGKSLGFWLLVQLRAMIIGDQHICAYYQTFQAGKDIFWPYYTTFDRRRAPIFDAQLGKLDEEGDVDGKDNTRGPACYKQYFKNDSLVMMPAPNWFQEAKGQAGQTFNMVGIDEWTKVETMTKKSTRVVNEKGDAVGGINQQILGRVRRRSWNQFHPIWGNHRVFMATAESPQHPGYRRYRNFLREIQAGNTDYAVFTSCFKDFSNLPEETDIRIDDCPDCKKDREAHAPSPRPSPAPAGEGGPTPCGTCQGEGRALLSVKGKPMKEAIPDWKTISTLKTELTTAHFKREGLGLWARDTRGWYSEEAIEKCVALGFTNNLQPEISRNASLGDVYYFLGYDPAPAQKQASDDAALAVLRARPRPGLGTPPTSNLGDWLCEYVWAYRMRGETKLHAKMDGVLFASTTSQMSGRVHACHRQFSLNGVLMDVGGGGNLIVPELNKGKQLINGVMMETPPIACPDDDTVGTNAELILNLFRRGDRGISTIWPLLKGDDNLAEAMHVAFQEAVDHLHVSFPLPFKERPGPTTADWEPERRWALINLDEARRQLMNIQALMNDDGTWAMTKNNARQFTAVGRKDLAYACIFAWVRFLIWLQIGEFEYQQDDGEDGIYEVK